MVRNEVLGCIHSRRSIRSFQEKQIADEQLVTLLDAAIWAPSGSNNQSWLFTAIQDQNVLFKLNELVRKGFQHWVPDDDYPVKLTIKARSAKENFNFYYHAPTVIIASNRPNYENAIADCALAMENIFLGAQSMGLGSCYLNQLHWLRDDTEVRNFLYRLGIPKEHTICAAAAIGYAAKQPVPPVRKDGTTHIIKQLD